MSEQKPALNSEAKAASSRKLSDTEPETVATPEGDNESAPDQPPTPVPDGLQRTPSIDTNKV